MLIFQGKIPISVMKKPAFAGLISGAQKRTRTSTELPPLAPEASASTNSATWALQERRLWAGHRTVSSLLCSQMYGRAETELVSWGNGKAFACVMACSSYHGRQ